MEMTCEQAIIILKAIYTNVLHCDEAPYTDAAQAIDLAVIALREKAEGEIARAETCSRLEDYLRDKDNGFI